MDYSNGMCIKSGIIAPTDTRPIYIENPVELDRNAAKTVEKPMLQRFHQQCLEAHERLEREVVLGRSTEDNWGVLTVLQESNS